MRGIRSLLFLGILISLPGCAAPVGLTPTSTPPSPPTHTQTLEPPAQDVSTATSTQSSGEVDATATSVPTTESDAGTDGPYFAYFQEVKGNKRLVLMNADGAGKKYIDLPKGIDLRANLLSPDGQWMAFHSGSAGDYDHMPAQGQADLTLNLLDLATGEQRVVTHLLSADYPNNFTEAAAKLNDEYKTAESLYQAFHYGIKSAIAWSPDGRYLAFGGQMDGLSSDLYVYDLQTQSIQRLSSGDQELQWIDWSPDGTWIVHGSLFAVGAGMTYDEYAATINGSSAPYLSTSPMGAGTWLNDHQFIEHDAENGPGNYGLRIVDVKTGNITKLWDGAFQEYTVSPSGKWVLLMAFTLNSPNPYQEDPVDFTPGWKLINLQTLEKTDAPEFLPDPPDAFLRAPDGELMPLLLQPYGMGAGHVSGSPDSQYWVVANGDEIQILSADLTLVRSVPAPISGLRDMQWWPDSSGLFLIYDTDIYALNVSEGSVRPVESSLIDDNYNTMYKWVTPQ